MPLVFRSDENPILGPSGENTWENEATFNGCPVFDKGKYHFVYRAVSSINKAAGTDLCLSSIGYAESRDGIHFKNRRPFIKPEESWERFGCEDPRVTRLNGKFYVFYTALSTYPFSADGIKIGLAITKDFKKVQAKHPVTPFNAKAMALFPDKVSGRLAAVLTVNTDRPPAKICLATFEKENQIWSPDYWDNWYGELDLHVIELQRDNNDHIEVGAPPIRTKYGWLLIYSYIENYFAPPVTFGIEAVLLDLKNPQKIIGRTERPLLTPDYDYEKYGKVPNIAFPSGATVRGDELRIYYGAADTTCCLATCSYKELMKELLASRNKIIRLERFGGNPIIRPDPDHPWEAQAVFNPAALKIDGKINILYRAMSLDNTSVLGYAATKDGITVEERLPEPAYRPREPFEGKLVPGGNSGCEDPRLTRIGDTIYMCYTAYDGKNPPRVALTSISVGDFSGKNWNWAKPVLVSPPGVDDKDAAIFPKKIKGKYVILHRLGLDIWIDFFDDLDFKSRKWLDGRVLMKPRGGKRDSKKIGIAGPPIETKQGWLLLYHGISKEDLSYGVRAALLDLDDPTKVLARTPDPILMPLTNYEMEGLVRDVVFPCGSVVLNDDLFVYYGGADKVIGVATIRLSELLSKMTAENRKKTPIGKRR
jgi:beta-1,2-mannobiose phosphorylase / 1,2-beta-oligomannan phosphorylase